MDIKEGEHPKVVTILSGVLLLVHMELSCLIDIIVYAKMDCNMRYIYYEVIRFSRIFLLILYCSASGMSTNSTVLS